MENSATKAVIAVGLCLSFSIIALGVAACVWRPPAIWAESGRPPPFFFGGLKDGTGFFVSADGDIMTDRHVVSGCGKITISGDGFQADEVRVIGYPTDPAIDLALLKTEVKPPAVLSFLPGMWADPSHQTIDEEKSTAIAAMVELFRQQGPNAYGIGFYGSEVEKTPTRFPVQFTKTINTDDHGHYFPVVQGMIMQGESGSPVLSKSGQVAGILFRGVGDLRVKPGEGTEWAIKTSDGLEANHGQLVPGQVADAFAEAMGVQMAGNLSTFPQNAVVRVFCFED